MTLLKYLLIFFLGMWLVKSILRGLLGRVISQSQQRNFDQQRSRQGRQGDIHVDYKSGKSGKNKTSSDYKGGEYIDYEEVD